jgi:hypothetical protein
MIEESIVKDPTLAPEGHRKIDWVAQHAPVLNAIFEERLSDGALDGRRVAMAIHLEAKTAYLAILLSEGGKGLRDPRPERGGLRGVSAADHRDRSGSDHRRRRRARKPSRR